MPFFMACTSTSSEVAAASLSLRGLLTLGRLGLDVGLESLQLDALKNRDTVLYTC